MRFSGKINSSMLAKLIAISKLNPYANSFRALKDVAYLKNCMISIKWNLGLDQRVYNTPSTSEVVGIWIENNDFGNNVSDNNLDREILIYNHFCQSHKVQHYYGCYDPLQYPLLFPHGDIGWHQGIKRINKRKRHTYYDTKTFIDPSALTSTMDLFDNEKKCVNIQDSFSLSSIKNKNLPMQHSKYSFFPSPMVRHEEKEWRSLVSNTIVTNYK